MRINSLHWLIISAIAAPVFCSAGKVRTLSTSSKEMPIIMLMPGRSTVLRFPSAPKKVVLGNQNYFNVEFIDSDVTLQPLGVASSNLFVYGDGFTYGFILKTGGGEYDDLVFIRGKLPVYQKVNTEDSAQKVTVKRKDQKYDLKIPASSQLRVTNTPFVWHQSIESYYSDLFLETAFKTKIGVKSLNWRMSSAGADLSSIAPVFESEVWEPGKALRVRIFSKLLTKDTAKIQMNIDGKSIEAEFKWRN